MISKEVFTKNISSVFGHYYYVFTHSNFNFRSTPCISLLCYRFLLSVIITEKQGNSHDQSLAISLLFGKNYKFKVFYLFAFLIIFKYCWISSCSGITRSAPFLVVMIEAATLAKFNISVRSSSFSPSIPCSQI